MLGDILLGSLWGIGGAMLLGIQWEDKQKNAGPGGRVVYSFDSQRQIGLRVHCGGRLIVA